MSSSAAVGNTRPKIKNAGEVKKGWCGKIGDFFKKVSNCLCHPKTLMWIGIVTSTIGLGLAAGFAGAATVATAGLFPVLVVGLSLIGAGIGCTVVAAIRTWSKAKTKQETDIEKDDKSNRNTNAEINPRPLKTKEIVRSERAEQSASRSPPKKGIYTLNDFPGDRETTFYIMKKRY